MPKDASKVVRYLLVDLAAQPHAVTAVLRALPCCTRTGDVRADDADPGHRVGRGAGRPAPAGPRRRLRRGWCGRCGGDRASAGSGGQAGARVRDERPGGRSDRPPAGRPGGCAGDRGGCVRAGSGRHLGHAAWHRHRDLAGTAAGRGGPAAGGAPVPRRGAGGAAVRHQPGGHRGDRPRGARTGRMAPQPRQTAGPAHDPHLGAGARRVVGSRRALLCWPPVVE